LRLASPRYNAPSENFGDAGMRDGQSSADGSQSQSQTRQSDDLQAHVTRQRTTVDKLPPEPVHLDTFL